MSGERRLQNVYILGEDEELIVRAKESFKDGEKERKPGDQWMIRGPGEYVPPVEVEEVLKRKANTLDEDEVRDFKTRRTVSCTPLAQATLQQREPVGPARAQLQTRTTTVATGLNPVQLAQRISAANTGVQQQQLQQATKTALTQQQFQILHNPNIFKQKPSQQQQQQQPVSPPTLLQTPQIIAATQFQPVTPATLSIMPQTVPTPEKTVSASDSVTIPSNASINLNLQQRGSVGKVSQLTPQQMQILQRKQIPLQKNPTQKVNATPMLNAVQIIQQQGGRSLTVHQLNQLINQQQTQGLSQILQTTPTIIATVTQSQAQPQITKVISTAGNIQTSQMQTIPVSATTISGIVTTSGSPVVTLSHVPSLNISSIAPGQSSVTASKVKPGSITTQDGVTTVQIHPVSTLSQARVSAGLSQNVAVQPMQHVTMATPSASQHGGSAQQQVTLTSPVVMSQPIHSHSHTDNPAAPDSGTHTTGTHYCDGSEEL